MPAESDEQLPKFDVAVGVRGGYQWITSDRHTIDDIVRSCPQVLFDRYLAITSTDSGDPKWWAERLPGWECLRGVAYSPRLESSNGIIYQRDGPDSSGFDEWYTFETRVVLGEVIHDENPWTDESRAKPGRIIAFVNHYFAPHFADEFMSPIFWEQIERLNPESYISDGAKAVVFVTRNRNLFQAVALCLRRRKLLITSYAAESST